MPDLRLRAEAPSPEETEAIDACIGVADVQGRRDLLLPALHAANDRAGWVTPGALSHICHRLAVAPADAYGVATFYDLLSVSERPPAVEFRCVDLACTIAGLRPPDAGTSTPSVIESSCLGLCDRAPALLRRESGQPSVITVIASPSESPVRVRGPLTERVGIVDPSSLQDYREHGGFAALATSREAGPAAVIEVIGRSHLSGRGGAAFPTARKWQAVLGQLRRPHYVVANADESEPGTFKDRVVMEGDPFSVVEAIALASFATGSDHAYIYLRGEYALAHERLSNAITTAAQAGLLGSLAIEIRRGGGAYICGEETAIFNSIEGFRGEPRSKPPYPTEVGLFGMPTAVNNVETLVAALSVMNGSDAQTKLFCVSGAVERGGVFEMTAGSTLRDVIDAAGGVRGASTLKAVLLGGAAGAFALPDELDTPLTADGLRSINGSLGSGVLMVLDESVDMRAFCRRIAEFFRHESCGQCVPCRVGTARQVELLAKGDRKLLADVDRAMTDASICGLGQSAASAIRSAIAKGLL